MRNILKPCRFLFRQLPVLYVVPIQSILESVAAARIREWIRAAARHEIECEENEDEDNEGDDEEKVSEFQEQFVAVK